MKVENLFTQLKNCNHRYLDVYDSKMVRGIVELLYREGSISYYQILKQKDSNKYHKGKKNNHTILRIFLKSQLSGPLRLPTKTKRGSNNFLKHGKLIPNLIITTSSQGICSGREARRLGIGGTVLGKL